MHLPKTAQEQHDEAMMALLADAVTTAGAKAASYQVGANKKKEGERTGGAAGALLACARGAATAAAAPRYRHQPRAASADV